MDRRVKMYQNVPWYGLMLRLIRWYSTRIGPFDVAMVGHFHTIGYWPINKFHLLLSGTPVLEDDWALETFGLESINRTWFFGTTDKYPISWQYALDYREA